VAVHTPNLSIGYETIEGCLEFSTQLLVVLLVIKLVMTAILGSGLVGGVLRQRCFWVPLWDRLMENPSIVTGRVVHGGSRLRHGGMAAVLAGSAKAPLTAILLLFRGTTALFCP